MFNIGVFGRSHGDISKIQISAAKKIGKEIADKKFFLLTGGCCGIPEHASIEARKTGGTVIGISPANNIKEHIEKYKQSKEIDINIFSGCGDTGRIPTNIKSSDAVIIVGGGYGTLAEFSCACVDKKLIGVLTGIGGISDAIKDIIKLLNIQPKSQIIFNDNPKNLIEEISTILKKEKEIC